MNLKEQLLKDFEDLKGMSDEQQDYTIAKAKYEQVREEIDKHTKNIKEEIHNSIDQERIIELYNKILNIEEEFCLQEYTADLVTTENKLIKWYLSEIEDKPEFNRINIDYIRDNYKIPKIKRKIIDLAIRHHK